MGDPTARLLELDAKHTELLDRLNELDEQVAAVLSDWTKTKESSPETIPMAGSQEAESHSAAA